MILKEFRSFHQVIQGLKGKGLQSCCLSNCENYNPVLLEPEPHKLVHFLIVNSQSSILLLRPPTLTASKFAVLWHKDLILSVWKKFEHPLWKCLIFVHAVFQLPLHQLFLLADWGHPDRGCEDNSDKVKDFNASNTLDPCGGNEYTYLDVEYGRWYTISVNWTWFPCYNTKKCIHDNNVCDLHPHPDCTYENNNLTISEDEEDCSSREFFYPFKICKNMKNQNFSDTNFNAKTYEIYVGQLIGNAL